MRKIQQLGTVISVEIPEALADWNEENESERARLNFAYASDATSLSDGEDEAARLLLAQCTTGSRYSVMVDLHPLTGKTTEEKRAFLEEQLKDKKVTFTTFVADVAELLEGTNFDGETLVNNGARDYRTLSDSFLGKNDDEKAAFDRLRGRIIRDLEDDVLFAGSIADKKDDRNNRRH